MTTEIDERFEKWRDDNWRPVAFNEESWSLAKLAFAAGAKAESERILADENNPAMWTQTKAIKAVLDYCAPHLDQMWAARIVGYLLNCDFRDSKEALRQRITRALGDSKKEGM